MKKRKKVVGNYLAKIIMGFREKPHSDASIKKVFSNKQILARIIHEVTPELQHLQCDEIANDLIEPKHHLTRDKFEFIDGLNTESIEVNEATIKFDVRFNVKLPEGTDERYEIHFDLEGQGTLYPGYSLPKRMMLYACRLITEQIKSLNKAKNVNRLQPICSIWICYNNVPQKTKGSILPLRIRTDEKFLYGSPKYTEDNFDFLRIFMITIPDEKSERPMLEMLRTLLTDEPSFDASTRLDKLKSLGIRVTEELEEGVTGMVGLLTAVGSRRFDEGKQIGLDEGKQIGFNEGCKAGESNYKQKLHVLRDRMKEVGRQEEFVDAIGNDERLEELCEEFGVK